MGIITTYNDQWWDERLDEASKESGSGFTQDKTLQLRWNGTYIIRLLPLTQRNDLFRQFGTHWNVFGGDDAPIKGPIGCPKTNYAEECIICDAINEAMASGRGTREDFYGMGGKIGLNRKFLMRGVLLKFTPENPNTQYTLPDLPALVYVLFPVKIQKIVTSWLKDGIEDIEPISAMDARKMLLDMDTGYPLRVRKSPKIDQYYSCELAKQPFSVPEEFRNSDEWEPIEGLLPKQHAKEMYALLQKYSEDIPELLVDYMDRSLAIDVKSEEVKALPEKTKAAAPKRSGKAVEYSEDDLERELANL